jgi:regulation of enolase protein 1 (concanavalin A-like superfamily)
MSRAVAASPSSQVRPFAGLPGPLTWQNQPFNWRVDENQTLSITSGKGSDWLFSPAGDGRIDNSPRLLFRPADDFVLSAKVTVGFHARRDSGLLIVFVNNTVWAKLALEMTQEMHPAIASVVTREFSDTGNSIAIARASAYLKVAKSGKAIYFSASEDGLNWHLVRSFSLGDTPNLRIGFSSQSPAGEGCTSVFSQIDYRPVRPGSIPER